MTFLYWKTQSYIVSWDVFNEGLEGMLCLDWFAAGCIIFPFRYFVFFCYWRNWRESCQDWPLLGRHRWFQCSVTCTVIVVCTEWEWGEWETVFEGVSPEPRAERQSITGNLSKRRMAGGRGEEACQGTRSNLGCWEFQLCWGVTVRDEGSWVDRAGSWHAKKLVGGFKKQNTFYYELYKMKTPNKHCL